MNHIFQSSLITGILIIVFSVAEAKELEPTQAVLKEKPTEVSQMSVTKEHLFVSYDRKEEKQELTRPIFYEGPYLFSITKPYDGQSTEVALRGARFTLAGGSGAFVPMLVGKRVVALRDHDDTVLLCNPVVLSQKFARCWQVIDGEVELAVGKIDY